MAAQNKSLYVTIGADLSQFAKDIKKASKDITVFGKELTGIGKQLTVGLTVPIAGFATIALASSKEATKAFSEFGDKTSKSMGRLGDEIFRAMNLQGILDSVSDGIKSMANSFAALPPTMQSVVVAFGSFLALLGPGILLIGQMSLMVGKLTAAWTAFWKISTLVLGGPWGILAVALTAVAVAAVAFTTGSERAAKGTQNFGLSAKEAAERLVEIKDALDDLESSRSIANKEAEIEKLKKEIETIQRLGGSFSGVAAAGGGFGAPESVRKSEGEREIANKTARLKQLQAELDGTREKELNLEKAMIIFNRTLQESGKTLRENELAYAAHGDELRNVRAEIDRLETRSKKLIETQALGLDFVQDGINKTEREIAVLKAREKVLQDNIQKQEQFNDRMRDLSKGSQDAQSTFDLMGGGVNVVNAQLTEQIEKYNLIRQYLGEQSPLLIGIRANIEALSGPLATFKGLMQEIPPLGRQIGQLLFDVVTSFSQGVGQAIANTLVFSADLGKGLLQVLKQVAAQVIATLIAMGIQKLIYALIFKKATASEAAAGFASLAGQIYLAAFLETAKIPFVGLALAPGVAAATVTTALAGAGASGLAGAAIGAGTTSAGGALGGVASAYRGGFFYNPGITTIGEKEPEVVMTRRHLQEFAGGDGRGDLHLTVELDGEIITRAVVPKMPNYLRVHGVTL